MNVTKFVFAHARLVSCSALALLMMTLPELRDARWAPVASMSTQPLPLVPPPAVALHPKPVRRAFSLSPKPMLVGIASWYGAVLDGHRTASGERFDMMQMTACHRTLPFGTMVRVVDLHSGKSVIVRINDRGVLFADRVIDLSVGAAERLGIKAMGVASVRLEVLGKKAVEQLASVRVPVAEQQ